MKSSFGSILTSLQQTYSGLECLGRNSFRLVSLAMSTLTLGLHHLVRDCTVFRFGNRRSSYFGLEFVSSPEPSFPSCAWIGSGLPRPGTGPYSLQFDHALNWSQNRTVLCRSLRTRAPKCHAPLLLLRIGRIVGPL